MQDMEGTLGMREGVDGVSSDDHQWSMYPLQKLFFGEPSSKQAWGVLFTGHLQGFTSSCFKPLFYTSVTQVVCNFNVYAHVQGLWEPLTASVGKKAGRVRLSTFYKKSLYSHWRFTEKVRLSECSQKPQQDHKHIIDSLAPVILLRIFEVTVLQRQCEADYLRKLGALDDSDPQQPQVIWPTTWWRASQSLVFVTWAMILIIPRLDPIAWKLPACPWTALAVFFQICLNLAITSWFGCWFMLETYLPFFEMLYRPGLTIFKLGLWLWITFVAGMQFAVGTNVSWSNHSSPISAQRNLETQRSPKTFQIFPEKTLVLNFLSTCPKGPLTQFFWNRLTSFVSTFIILYLQVWSFGVGGWS